MTRPVRSSVASGGRGLPAQRNSEFAVVLQHPGLGVGGPVEQRQAAADRQRAAERGGVRGGDEDEAGLGGEGDAGGHVQPVGVAGHRHGHDAGGDEGAAAGDVAGVFHPGGLAGVEHEVGGDAQRLLGAGGDHDLGGIGDEAARGGEMGGDLGA